LKPFRVIALLVAALSAGSLLSSCGSGGDSDEATSGACNTLGLKVINGESCSIDRSPVTVVLTENPNGVVALCSGTLISPTKVLTAAHCYRSNTVDSAVAVGRNVYGVSKAVRHPDYDANSPLGVSAFDIAVLTLDATSAVTPVPILSSDRVSSGELYTIFGFGADEKGRDALDRDRDDRLKSANMIVSATSENLFFGNFDALGATICKGDSGGPAIQVVNGTGSIVGVSSFDVAGCGRGSTSGFGTVASARNLAFIKKEAPEATYR